MMFGFRKHPLPEDFFQGFCDVHSHLLPGVDDGFPTLEKSLHALRELEDIGVERIILTPHFMKDYPDNNRNSILEAFASFKAEAGRVCGIDLRIAGEYMLDSRFLEHFGQGILTLDGKNHVLCETSYIMHEPSAPDMVYKIMLEDFHPVIAHPERYEYAEKNDYYRWKDKRYKFQLNLLSLAGAYGGMAAVKALFLLKEGMYDFIGTDMHSLSHVRHHLSKLRLKSKDIEQLEQLLANNKKLVY